MAEPEIPELFRAAQVVAEKLDADVILFNQPISETAAARFHEKLEISSRTRENVFFVVCSLGGDAHAAYMIGRDLQLRYKRVTICIAGDCYSAGTLIVLSAHNLVIADRGRLGPLDVQLLKKDELSERLSGLTVGIALEELHKQAANTFEEIVLQLKLDFGRSLSLKTAMEIASSMTSQMFGEIYRQIDPIRLGEDARALQVASHYGKILGGASKNLKPGAVDRLLSGYPSHECIIDRKEATELFEHLRSPTDEELTFLAKLGPFAAYATEDAKPELMIVFPDVQEAGRKTNGNTKDNEKSPTPPPRG